MPKARDGTLASWFTLVERARDERTGAVAEISFDSGNSWIWRVFHSSGEKRGESTTQKGARAAARKHVRALPTDSDTTKKRQLSLF